MGACISNFLQVQAAVKCIVPFEPFTMPLLADEFQLF
jgi:hypothetical protein